MALHLAVALDGAGWHPAAWREPAARPSELCTAGYWTDLIGEAERGLLDFVTIEDALAPQSTSRKRLDDRTDQVRGRLDAVLIAARVAPRTTHIGLVPTISAYSTEPFHISKAIATLDYTATGRAGVRVQLGGYPSELPHFGRRAFEADPAAKFAEGADYVEVVRRLWDSWEDDAEIRDAATGRFVDRDKLHYIDFAGKWFSVKGPSITPRPPQGQPLVTALAHVTEAYRFAARSTDLVYVTPKDTANAREIVAEINELGGVQHIFADLVVFLDDEPGKARTRKQRLDETAGEEYKSDALIFTGTAGELADLLLDLGSAGLSGFRLRPGALPDDLDRITRELVPELQRRNAFRTEYAAETLRERFGLDRPANRYGAVK